MEGGRTCRFDCIIIVKLNFKNNNNVCVVLLREILAAYFL